MNFMRYWGLYPKDLNMTALTQYFKPYQCAPSAGMHGPRCLGSRMEAALTCTGYPGFAGMGTPLRSPSPVPRPPRGR